MPRHRPPTGPPAGPDRKALLFCAVVAGSVVFLVVISVLLFPPEPPASPTRWPLGMAPRAARAALDALPVVDVADEVAYDRVADFGPAWQDVDHNGCDTRNDILRRDLSAITERPGTHGCVVVSGLLDDPYTGVRLAFRKAHAADIQIDHLVPLHAAWMLGAWRWTPERRRAYANDPRVLVAVDGPANLDKGDALADRWRPPNRGAWCAYAVNTVAIHRAYRLGVTRDERSALRQMMAKCAK